MGKVSNAIECKGFSFGEVTGSCYQVNYNGYNFLLDCGAKQTQNIVDDYKSNVKMIRNIKAKEIRAIIVGHVHQDHIGIIQLCIKTDVLQLFFLLNIQKS